MELVFLSTNDQQKYDSFVAAHDSGSFLQSWQWGDWQEHLGRTVSRCFIIDNGSILLSAQIIKTPISRLRRYYLYIPYGPLVADNISENDATAALHHFTAELKKEFSQAVFIRIEPVQNYVSALTFRNIKKSKNIQSAKTLVLDLEKSEEELLATMHPKTRYNIKVAQRHGVSVESQLIALPGHGLHLAEVVQLIHDTARRQHYKDYPSTYYKSMIDYFGVHPGNTTLTIYKAFYQKNLLASGIMIDFGQTRAYLFGGSSDQNRNVMAPFLFHWQAIQDAKGKGLRWYDFGGSETASGNGDLGFGRFKLGFGTIERSFPGAYDIVLKPLWYNAYTVLRSLNRKLR